MVSKSFREVIKDKCLGDTLKVRYSDNSSFVGVVDYVYHHGTKAERANACVSHRKSKTFEIVSYDNKNDCYYDFNRQDDVLRCAMLLLEKKI